MNRGLKGGLLRPFSKKQINDIHLATIEILENTGIEVHSARIMEVFQRGGAEVDYKKRKVWIPEHLVKEALNNAPSKVILCGRNPKYDIVLEDSRVYYGMGGTPTPFIRDIETGHFRRPTKKDMADATRLGDALEHYSFIMAIAGAFDVPYEVEYEHEWEALFNNTEKPIVYSAPGVISTKRVLEMASAIVGGQEELRRRPILSLYSETVSPLAMFEPNETMIECATAGIPVTLSPGPVVGASGPGTVAGSSVVLNAENLAAITLMQLAKKNSPVIYAHSVTIMDPRTGRVCYGAPELALASSVLNAQLAEFYRLPTFGFSGGSDSKLPDAQAGCETMMLALMNALAGINLMHDCGYLAGGSVGSMEMAVICNEILGDVSRIIRGIDINDETLAVDIIRAVGPGGHFFSQKHTLDFIGREIHMPKLFDRNAPETWLKEGGKDIAAKAKEQVKRILREHYAQPLPAEIRKKIAEIVKEEERELVKQV